MKKRLLYVIIACLVAGTQMATAQFAESGSVTKVENGIYYVYYETKEVSIYYDESKTFDLKGPGATLSFDGKRSSSGYGNLRVKEKETGQQLFSERLTTSYVSKPSISLTSNDVTALIFDTHNGATLYKYVKNVKVTMAQYLEGAPAELTMPEKGVNESDTASFNFKWCNLGDITITSSNPNLFKVSTTSVPATQGKWGKTSVTVTCTHNVAGANQEGTITISGGGKTQTVRVKSSTKKNTATITWSKEVNWGDELTNIAYGTVIPNAVSKGDAPVELTLTSSNEDVLKVEDGTTVTAVGEGEATLTAKIIENDTYYEKIENRLINVEKKEVQTIVWEQNIAVVPNTTETIELNAYAVNASNAATGLDVTYESSNPEVATIDGTTLKIVGVGNTNITASVIGDNTYFPAYLTKGMTVYDPAFACPDVFIYDGEFQVSIGSVDEDKSNDIFLQGKEPATLSFSAKSGNQTFFDSSNKTEITISQKIDGSWTQIQKVSVTNKETSTFPSISLDRRATDVRFYVAWNEAGTTVTFSNVEIKQLRYLETETKSIAFNPLNLNAIDKKDITLNYSALASMCGIYMQKGEVFSVAEGITFGEGCGSVGSKTFAVHFSSQGLATEDCGIYEDTILIINSQIETILRIPVSGTVEQLRQVIEWEPTTTIHTIDNVTVPATTSAKLPITYTSSDAETAYVNENYELVIIKHGSVTITANAEGNNVYQAAPAVAHTFTINTTPYTTTLDEKTLATLSKVTYGTKLGDIALTGTATDEAGNTVAGTFAFVDTELPPPGETNEYNVIFTPTDANYYAPITVQAAVTVNPRLTQNITWTQNIAAVPLGTEPITLNAVTDAVPTADYPLVYTSSNPDVASVEGNILTFHQLGETNITVSQVGSLAYDPVYLTKSLEVYDPKAGCKEHLLYASSFEFASNWSSLSEGKKDITWDNSVTATTLRFTAKSEKGRKLYIDAYKGNTKQEKWQTIDIPKTETNYDYSFDPSITKFVFRMPGKEGGSGTAVYTNVEVVQQSYMNLSLTEHDFGTIEQNTVATQEITIDFSALPTVRNVHLENPDGVFSLEGNDAFGSGCGSTGTETFTVQFSTQGLTKEQMNTTFTNTLWIIDANGERIQSIPLQGAVKPRALVTTPEVAVPANSVFHELLYAAGANMNPTYEGDVHMVAKPYYLMQVRAADDWHTFVAPFDITNAYVLELVSEPENPRAAGVRDQMIEAQKTATEAFYAYLQSELPKADADKSVMTLIEEYIANPENAAVDILPITENYELHESAAEWEMTSDDKGDPIFTPKWIEKTTEWTMTKERTYAMRFLWCEYCANRIPWDYWTGKLILFEGEAEQTIYGKSAQVNIPPYESSENAILTGNYTLANMEINNAYVHNIKTDMYDRVSADTIVAPTTSIIYTNIPNKQGKRAKAIARTGQIIYEGDNSNVATALPTTSEASFTVVAQQDGITIFGTATEHVAIYNISGVLLYAGTIHADEQRFIPAETGMYIVRSAQAVQKVLVR